MNNEISEVKKKIIKKWEARLPDFLKFIEGQEKRQQNIGIPPEIVSTVLAIGLVESSRKIEHYSRILALLTVVLVILTVVLAARTFLPNP